MQGRVQANIAKLNKLAVGTVNDKEAMKQIDAQRVELMRLMNQVLMGMEGGYNPD